MIGIFDRFSNILEPAAIAARNLGFSCEIYSDIDDYRRSRAVLVLVHGSDETWHRVTHAKKVKFPRSFLRATTIGFPEPPNSEILGTNMYLFYLARPVDEMTEEDWLAVIPYMLKESNWKRLLEGCNEVALLDRYFSPQRIYKKAASLSLLCQIYLVVWVVDSKGASEVIDEALATMGEKLLEGELRADVTESARGHLDEVSSQGWWLAPFDWMTCESACLDLEPEINVLSPEEVRPIFKLIDAIFSETDRATCEFANAVASSYVSIVRMSKGTR